ncbi:ankyrin repeat domain-containing protein 49 [Echinops telfairi]|uniref:Ankyrin repeat domain-containing protein 49 n=1 Tax=Echinops telfairi TaxID=9371 RepID=A0ABM0IW38_ECHTE|nr:ankyrin repeat domain-containing protein 49 [Echinops telfairi]
MEKDQVNNDENPDPENSLDFSEQFNQLELLETHRHLIPTGTQSLWGDSSEEDEEQDEKTEEWYQLQEKSMENDPSALLLWAAEQNRLTTVQRLLSENATHVNTRDEDEYTPLHRAAYGGHLDIVRELIAQGADVHAVTVDGWTPLHSACKWNNTSVASLLLQHDADINAQTKGRLTPLHFAAGNRDSKDTLELLLMNRYIKPSLRNNLDETAFEIARRTSTYHYLFEIVDGCTNSQPQS